jgi:polyhydroxyalkanoate synthesis regulator phasin
LLALALWRCLSPASRYRRSQMGKIKLAKALVSKLGMTFSQALRFIDDVGVSKARKAIDDAAARGGQTVEKWWKPAAGTGVVVGGGTLAWRQQDIERAKQIANQRQSRANALKQIATSQMSAESKKELMRDLVNQSGSDSDGGDNSGADDPLSNLLGGDLQKTVILVLVLAFTLKYSLGAE